MNMLEAFYILQEGRIAKFNETEKDITRISNAVDTFEDLYLVLRGNRLKLSAREFKFKCKEFVCCSTAILRKVSELKQNKWICGVILDGNMIAEESAVVDFNYYKNNNLDKRISYMLKTTDNKCYIKFRSTSVEIPIETYDQYAEAMININDFLDPDIRLVEPIGHATVSNKLDVLRNYNLKAEDIVELYKYPPHRFKGVTEDDLLSSSSQLDESEVRIANISKTDPRFKDGYYYFPEQAVKGIILPEQCRRYLETRVGSKCYALKFIKTQLTRHNLSVKNIVYYKGLSDERFYEEFNKYITEDSRLELKAKGQASYKGITDIGKKKGLEKSIVTRRAPSEQYDTDMKIDLYNVRPQILDTPSLKFNRLREVTSDVVDIRGELERTSFVDTKLKVEGRYRTVPSRLEVQGLIYRKTTNGLEFLMRKIGSSLNLPGGGVDAQKDLAVQDTLIREVEEELNIKVKNIYNTKKSVWRKQSAADWAWQEKHLKLGDRLYGHLTVILIAEYRGEGNNDLPEESKTYKWHPIQDLLSCKDLKAQVCIEALQQQHLL